MEYKSSENRLFEILLLEKGFLDKSSFNNNNSKSNFALILENGKISNSNKIKHSKKLLNKMKNEDIFDRN